MKIIIAGSRTINDYQKLERVIWRLRNFENWEITEIISGGARGVDQMGERWARENNVPVKKFIPNWDKHGKSAGILRNIEMAKYSDALIALWDGESRGTLHMIAQANKNLLNVYVSTIRS